jgi:hypothetical protein
MINAVHPDLPICLSQQQPQPQAPGSKRNATVHLRHLCAGGPQRFASILQLRLLGGFNARDSRFRGIILRFDRSGRPKGERFGQPLLQI